MSTSRLFVKYFGLLCVMQLSAFLVGCDGNTYEGPGLLPDAEGNSPGGSTPPPDGAVPKSEILVTASVEEGFNPLNVTFNVSSPSGAIERVEWSIGNDTVETTGNASIPYTFVNPGRKTVSVTAFTDDQFSEDYQFKLTINVLPNVNLVVSSFAIDAEVTPGSLETISAIIQNTGTDMFTDDEAQEGISHIDVGYYLSTDDIITVDDIYIGDTSIVIGEFFTCSDLPFGFQSLAPGENYQYDHQLAIKGNVPAGTYFAGAIVDYIDEFHWYTFPRATNTLEFSFPSYTVVPETNEDDNAEEDNARLLTAHQVAVTAPACVDDSFEPDDSSATATPITVGETQAHNFCFDNSDWLQFDASQGSVYKITTFLLDAEADTQLILYDTDGNSILLFHDNVDHKPDAAFFSCPDGDNKFTVDLECGTPINATSEIVWETEVTGTYFIKVRTTACDEDKDLHCSGSPDGVGLDTGYSVTLQ